MNPDSERIELDKAIGRYSDAKHRLRHVMWRTQRLAENARRDLLESKAECLREFEVLEAPIAKEGQ